MTRLHPALAVLEASWPGMFSSAACTCADDETKRTNEVGMVLPLLDDLELDFDGRTFTADALLTQRKLARHLRPGTGRRASPCLWLPARTGYV